mmetsp:Transcript_48356/g.104137  ORF Transcript_48356/g.104137 Transcript_48356/m.104137 type:complete len:741 (+) Transcript_48356:41-2263(+)
MAAAAAASSNHLIERRSRDLAFLAALVRIVELLAARASDALAVGLVCKSFQSLLWDVSTGRLQTPALLLRGHLPDGIALERTQPGGLLSLKALNSSLVFGQPSLFLSDFLPRGARGLQRLGLHLSSSELTSCWPRILELLSLALSTARPGTSCSSSAAREIQAPPNLEELMLHGTSFPREAEACEHLGSVLASCSNRLQLLDLTFPKALDPSSAVLSDGPFWDALQRCRRLRQLVLSGLPFSQRATTALPTVLVASAGSLRSLSLTGPSASVLLKSHADGSEGGADAGEGEVSSSIHRLIAAGQKLQLRELTLRSMCVTNGSEIVVGSGRSNLAALLCGIELLAPELEVLNLSDSGWLGVPLPALGNFSNGTEFLESLLPQCYSLRELHLAGCALPLSSLTVMLTSRARYLRKLSLPDLWVQGHGLAVETSLSKLGQVLRSFGQLQELDVGELGARQDTRRHICTLLSSVAPSLVRLSGCFQTELLIEGLSSIFKTGTCREGGARQLEAFDVTLRSRPLDSLEGLQSVLRANSTTLRSISIRGMLGDKAASILFSVLRTAPLRRLTIMYAGLSSSAASVFAALLRRGGITTPEPERTRWSFDVLVLDGLDTRAEAASLVEAITNSRCTRFLHRLCLSCCSIRGPEVAQEIGRLLMNSESLLELDLRRNVDFSRADFDELLQKALQEWGKRVSAPPSALRKSVRRPIPLNGVVYFGDCRVISDDLSRPVPSRIGRWTFLWR